MSVEILSVKLELKQYAVADACAAWWWNSIVNDDAAVAKHLSKIPGVDLGAHCFYSFRIIVTIFLSSLLPCNSCCRLLLYSLLGFAACIVLFVTSRHGLSLLLASLLCWRPAHPFPINDISHRTSRPPARSSLILFAPTTMPVGFTTIP